MKEDIIDTIKDLVSDFLYYDRKEDEELQLGDIEVAIKNEVITRDEIVNEFKKELNIKLDK